MGKFSGGVIARMFDDPFTNFESEIQAGIFKIALFELFDDVERMQIVIETLAMFPHAPVQLLFAGVAEGRMTDVMNQREGFGKISVEFQGSRDGARNLGDFESVREAVAEMIGIACGENLRFGFQTAKRAGVN